MGAVYLARDLQLQGAWWALKTLCEDEIAEGELAETRRMFAREADILSRLRHPGLPRVIDFFIEGNHHVLVMQRIEGDTLDDIMTRQGRPFTQAELLGPLIQLAACLRYLHRQQPHPVIFRDLKPSNCMLGKDGKLWLIDFGIARYHRQAKSSDTMVLGTPGFCAPEQYGGAQTEPRSDIYSWGVMAWHLLSGQDPAEANFQFAPLRQVAPACSAELEAVVMRCVALDREARYPSADELLADLEFVRQQACTRKTASSWPPGVTPQVRAAATSRLPSPRLVGNPTPPTAASFTPVRPSQSAHEAGPWQSWWRDSFKVWFGPGSLHLPRFIALMLLMVFLVPVSQLAAQLNPPPPQNVEAADHGRYLQERVACQTSMQNACVLLEQYKREHHAYPSTLGEQDESGICQHACYLVSPDRLSYDLWCAYHNIRVVGGRAVIEHRQGESR